VLDDLVGEAKEIRQKGNGWLTYSPLLHKIREGGTFTKLFDFLDERQFTPVEVALLAQLLLRDEGEEPFPSAPFDFLDVLEARLPLVPPVYDPLNRTMSPPVHLRAARWAVVTPLQQVGKHVRSLWSSAICPFTSALGICSTDPRARRELHYDDETGNDE